MSEFNDGVVTVPGFETLVHYYHTIKGALDLLVSGQKDGDKSLALETIKSKFREVARAAGEGTRRLDLLGKSAKEIVMVLLPDITKEASRLALSVEKKQEIARERISEILSELGQPQALFEEKHSFTLTGQWYEYFAREVLTRTYGPTWETQELPSGCTHEVSTRLSVQGVKNLRMILAHPQATEAQKGAARRLLELGLKQPTVEVG